MRLHLWILANATISRVFDELLTHPRKLQFSCHYHSTMLHIYTIYNKHCIFIHVIKEAKRWYYDNQLLDSTNKIKTTWKIVNLETHRKSSNAAVDSLNIVGRIIHNQQLIANTYNNYFLSKTDNINNDDDDDDNNNNNNNNNNNTQNKYNPNTENNNRSLQSISHIYKSTYTKIR